jgi:molybdopterin/thiamine biosynthesis adenylyltransferase
MYSRNRIYISRDEQQRMCDFKIVFGGLGLGSVIAECALRIGFENLHLIDGDIVEVSNLNRQNYTPNDIGKPKSIAVYERLKSINPKANITYSNVYLTAKNLSEHLTGADIAVNAIDFATSAPLVFDDVCLKMGVPSVHPYNLGYGGLACVFTKNSLNLKSLSYVYEGMEINVAKHVMSVLEKKGHDMRVFKNVLTKYAAEQGTEQSPQLSIGAWILGGFCTDIFLKIFRNESVSVFPDFYYLDSKINSFKS